MAIRQEQNPITEKLEYVIDGWENGISDNPERGSANIKNINIDSIPGVAMCNHKLMPQIQTSMSDTFTVNAANHTITLVTATTPILYGAPVVISGASLPAELHAGYTYYFLSSSGVGVSDTTGYLTDTFNPITGYGSPVQITAGSGAIGSFDMTKPTAYTTDTLRNGLSGNYYVVDSFGRVWTNVNGAGSGQPGLIWTVLKYGGNTGTPTDASGNGICFFKHYLFVFRNAKIDIYDAYGQEVSPYSWTSNWGTLKTSASFTLPHPAIWGQDNVLYYGDGSFLGNISSQGDNPVIPKPKIADFVKDVAVQTATLQLPLNEIISCLEEPSIDASPGNYIYIGTSTSNYIYPWNKTPQQYTLANGTILTTAYDAPLVMPEVGTYQMLNINKLVYILAGQRGNIYYTNGSSIVHFSKVPYQPTLTPYPVFTWGGIMSLRNNLVFGATDVNGNAAGVWSIALAVGQMLNNVAGAIRNIGQVSGGAFNPTVLIPNSNGLNYYAGWYNTALTRGGMDYLDTATPTFYTYNATPATSQGSYIETEIIPIGTAINPKNLTVIEVKLDTALVSGEKFRVCMRNNLSDTYVKVFEQTATGAVDGNNSGVGVPLINLKWVQFRIDLQTVSAGSFVRIKELRFR